MKKVLLIAAVLCLAAIGTRAGNPARQRLGIVFIGNSITFGALHADRSKTAPPVYASQYVGKMLGCEIDFRNCGRSGATTVDYLPERAGDFKRVETALKELDGGCTGVIFSIMLGTNDSATKGPTGSPVSNGDYKANLLKLIGKLKEMCPGAIFVLHKPVWYSPNTYNGAVYLVAGQKRLAGYSPVLDEIVAENEDVYAGDKASYGFFEKHYSKYCFPENGNAGVFYLHPNEAGARKLARNWARAIVAAVKDSQR